MHAPCCAVTHEIWGNTLHENTNYIYVSLFSFILKKNEKMREGRIILKFLSESLWVKNEH